MSQLNNKRSLESMDIAFMTFMELLRKRYRTILLMYRMKENCHIYLITLADVENDFSIYIFDGLLACRTTCLSDEDIVNLINWVCCFKFK